MTYEEKREFHKIISQMLADEGLNQGKLKEIVEETIKSKVDAAVDKALASLNAECGDSKGYIANRVNLLVSRNLTDELRWAIRDELGKRIINIEFKENVTATIAQKEDA